MQLLRPPTAWRAVDCPPESPSVARAFFTTVAGVTFEGRQRIVARCTEDENLILVRDPNNVHDKGAIKVMRLNGQQLGFVPAHVSRGDDSSGLACRMDRGDRYKCRISNLTGGGTSNLGVNIEITPVMDDAGASAVASTYSERCSAAMAVARATEDNSSGSTHVDGSKPASGTEVDAKSGTASEWPKITVPLCILAVVIIGCLWVASR